MKILIIYHSEHHGNTEKVVKAMGNEVNADVVKSYDFDLNRINEIINQYDIIGLGSGIYSGKHHKNILNIADGLPKNCKVKFFIFSTSGVDALSRGYHNALKSILNSRGINLIGEFNCLGFDTAIISSGINKGRPDEDDLEKAKDFMRKIVLKKYNFSS